ncbi:MAG: PAS domain-containing protein [Hyphomicrobiales bacterium]|nr:PAS domain-containing protein [Hyphomicrobiales bacterium]
MRQAATQQIYAYWNDLRKERSAPERTDIDPSAIRGALAETFIIEADEAGTFPLRLSGGRLNALSMNELKGRSFANLWGADAPQVVALLRTVMDGAAPVVAGARGAPAGRDVLDVEMLFLPLRHFGKTHARILGAIAYSGAPAWLGLLPVERLELKSLRILRPEEARALGVRPSVNRFRRAGDAPTLRVIPGGRT